MRRVKIKSVPTGQQVNHALWRNQKVYNNTTEKPKVSNIMGATKDDDANVEVEGGETAVGDINLDGLIELMSFQGKRHSQGGMPVKLPEGTFIYSDTPKLRIKDPEILAMFNMGKKKSGYTPAEISKQYLDLNSHIDTLKNPDVDPISRQTAEMMIKKNTAKLGELALIQESMKGFENGIPSIAESALAGLSPEVQQVAKCGGRVKMQKAGGELIINGKDQAIPVNSNGNTSQTISTNQSPTASTFDPRYPLVPTKKRFQDYTLIENILYNPSNDPLLAGISKFHEAVNLPINLGIQGINRLFMHNPFKYDDASEIINPDVAHYPQYIAKMFGYTDPNPNTNIPNSIPFEPKAVRPPIRSVKYSTPPQQVYINNQPYTYDKTDGNVHTFKSQSGQPFTVTNTYFDQSLDKQPLIKNINNNKQIQYTITSKPSSISNKSTYTTQSTSKVNAYRDAVSKYQKFGGELKKYQKAGEVIKPTEKEGRIYYGDIEITKGKNYDSFTKDGKIYYIKDNKIVAVNDPTLKRMVELQDDGTYKISIDNISYISNTNPDLYDYNTSEYKATVTDFNSFIDSDKDLQKDIYDNFIKRYTIAYNNIVANPTKYGQTTESIKSLPKPEDITKDQVIAILKRGNEENSKILTYYGNTDILNDENWDNWTGGRNYYYQNLAKNVGITPMTDAEILIFQTAYQGASDASRMNNNVEKFRNKGFQVTPKGVADEDWNTDQNISYGDLTYGNTTLGQIIQRTDTKQKDEKETDTKQKDEKETDTKQKDEKEVVAPPKYQPVRKDIDTWFAPDIMNFVGAMTDRINRYEPSQGKIDLVKPGYDLLSPDRQLAANQEQMARYQNQIENSADSNVGLATMLAASGAGFQNAANVLGNIENANVGIVNNAYGQRAAIENQEIASNETMRQKYIQDMAILNQNQDEAENARKWRRIGAWNQGWQNYTKDKMMEEILFPQVHIDNITGEYSFPGGRDPNAIDLYRNYYLGQQSQKGHRQQMSADDYLNYYKQFSAEYKKQVPTATEEDTRALFNNWIKMADTDSNEYLYGGNVYPF